VRTVLPAGFPQGITADVRAVHRDGSTLLIEFRGRATTNRQRVYDNAYCFVLTFRHGLVTAIREYMDTLYAQVVLHS